MAWYECEQHGELTMVARAAQVRPHLDRIQWSDNRREEANDSHARIDSALVAGDVEQAQSDMRGHMRTACNSLLNEMRQPSAMNGNGATHPLMFCPPAREPR